ncbi:uncharacterized protein LOC123257349 [Drosophila ananassae]|nr:uncharacterized protein LOC123257349 [Drosophila ananassae]
MPWQGPRSLWQHCRRSWQRCGCGRSGGSQRPQLSIAWSRYQRMP